MNITVCIISLSVLVIAVFFFFFNNGSKTQPKLIDVPSDLYDYIIVGAGSAGSVVASRLSENPNVTVLLVEAGGDDRDEERISIPAFFGMLSDYIWEMPIGTNQNTSDFENDRVTMKNGMVLGGGSSVNVLVYGRGSRHDFNQWSKLTKDKTWDYDHVLPYFKKSEGALDDDLKSSVYHGKEGPLSVSTHKNGWSIYRLLIDALKEIGFPRNDDYNGELMEGASFTQYNIANGERVSSSKAFIHPVLDRPNLHVMINAFVERVLVDEDGKARGIEMITKSKKSIVKAVKEIILSSGTLQSPKILMLSGIGPKDILIQHGIKVVKDLPVGQNLQTHPLTDISISVTCQVTGVNDPFLPSLSYILYKAFRSGSLATADADVIVHASMTPESKAKHWPDLQILLEGKPLGSLFMNFFDFDKDIIKELAKARDAHRYGFGCLPAVLRPKARGIFSISSKDPFDSPVARMNYVEAHEDMDILIRGIRICQSLINTEAMKSVGAFLTDSDPLSVCKDHKFDSDDYWACYIRKKPMLYYHPVGTCKMGSEDDPTAVVDSRLRVKGIQGLRVVDASIMPVIVSGTTHAATVMIAEKAADMILEESDK